MKTNFVKPSIKLLSTLLIIALLITTMPLTVFAAGVDFAQLETIPAAAWVNGNLNGNNSYYVEGMSTPQRVIVSGIDPAVTDHSVTLSYQFTKSGKYAYDFLTSWDQAVAAASAIGGKTWSDSWKWLPDTDGSKWTSHLAVDVPEDSYATAARELLYESMYGNRTIDLYGNGTISSAAVTINSLSGDLSASTVIWTVSWTGTATEVMILYAGHIAVGLDFPATGLGWGEGMGAGEISGSPYHHTLVSGSDWSGGSSKDNQMQASSIFLKSGIAGMKWHDINGDGIRQANGADGIAGNADDEVGLAGWTIFIDFDGDGVFDAGEPSAVTEADGTYMLYFLLADQKAMDVKVNEVQQTDW
ncbi:MAG TPA: hypothetical protein DD640_08130, partial [Clostridiales bacterium]|nr:hypothetical protein [Clostridiales bacterium]